ncbi:aldo/keto reductase [Aminipila luticellarii]|uniref:4Fe-4S dicluster domain-containing protein n=1 Tax=Aminipila luticellarii TaxID=2507160 RepID=A0A410PX95_9FIRM|nr:aldo/keto reductase [Aminipila luticellarii]QAT43561.1 4Fe-4S dicluster domain-containing protein [Aminipila luticellarii]
MNNKKLGFGFMRLPVTDPANQASIDMDQLNKMVDVFMAKGFRYFDLAYFYHFGACEKAFGETVAKRYPREQFDVATKMPLAILQSKEQQEQIFQEQLTRCGVSHFDYYLLHSVDVKTYKTARKLDSFNFLRRIKESGKAKKTGFSFHDTPDLLDEILTENPYVDFVQLQINYLDWDDIAIQSEKCHAVAKKHGKAIVVMEPVKGGALANVPKDAEHILREYNPTLSPASWAVRFAASQENVFMVLSGMSNLEQLNDNVSYMEDFKPLSGEEQAVLNQAIDKIREGIKIPCTACRYCETHCPKNIAIPEYFTLYNTFELATDKDMAIQTGYYLQLQGTRGKPDDCIKCRKCEEICPQHLKIPEYLQEVSEGFAGAMRLWS